MPNQWFSKSLIRSRSNMKTNSKIKEKHNLDKYLHIQDNYNFLTISI